MIYSVSSEFTKINETPCTIQNTSNIFTLEISDTDEENSGILLYPLQSCVCHGDIFVRCIEAIGVVQIRASPVLLSVSSDDSGTPAEQETLRFSQADLQKIFED